MRAPASSVIASEAKQSRSRQRKSWAFSPRPHWIASPAARNDELGNVSASGASALIAEWSVALVAAALSALLIGRGYEAAVFTVALAAAPLVAWIVVQDLCTFAIADGAVIALGVLALAVRLAAGDPALVLLADVLLTGGVLLAFRELYYRRRGFDGLGLGDVKLAAAGGLLVGAQTFAWAMLGASLLALGSIAVLHLVGRGAASPQKLAFGAFLAPSLYAAWIVQQLPILWPGGA